MIKPREIERALDGIKPELAQQLIYKCMSPQEKHLAAAKPSDDGYSDGVQKIGVIDFGERIVKEMQEKNYDGISFENLGHGLEDAANKLIGDINKGNDVSADLNDRANRFCVGQVMEGVAVSGALRATPVLVAAITQQAKNALDKKPIQPSNNKKLTGTTLKPSNT